MVDKNYKDLASAIAHFESEGNAPLYWAEENWNTRHEFHCELHRLLHNFMASVMTLVCHSRNLIKEKYEGTLLQLHWDEQIKIRFAGKPLHTFVQDLRNYTLHCNLPATSLSYLWNGSSVRLSSEHLLLWDNWREPSEEYIRSHPTGISLQQVIDAYYSSIHEFYEWFVDELCSFHAQDLEEYRHLREKYEGESLSGYTYRDILTWFR